MSLTQIIAGETRQLDAMADYRASEATHAACFELPNGAKLAIARTPSAWYVAGIRDGKRKQIALSHEATEVFVSAVLNTRARRRPLPTVKLNRISA